ncbi:hypothetical protein [Embleya sp. NPDC001921]
MDATNLLAQLLTGLLTDLPSALLATLALPALRRLRHRRRNDNE